MKPVAAVAATAAADAVSLCKNNNRLRILESSACSILRRFHLITASSKGCYLGQERHSCRIPETKIDSTAEQQYYFLERGFVARFFLAGT